MSPFQFSSLSPKELRFITKALALNPNPLNASVPTVGADPRKVIVDSLRHVRKALSPMLVTPLGIMIFLRLLQELKAFAPILLTPLPIVMLVRLMH